MRTSGDALTGERERRVRKAVADVRPDLAEAGALRPLGEGFESVALLLEPPGGPAHVLRFPRNEDGAEGIACETRLLPELAPRLPVPVPRFAFTAPNPLGPGTFCCYPAVPGDSLRPEEWHARGLLDEPGPVRLIARVLDAVHAFPAERARELGVPLQEPREEYADSERLAREHVVPLLPRGEADALLAAFGAYLGDDANFPDEPVLIHGDVSLDHLLVTGTEITGLIDFGDVAVGDPDFDLAYLWQQAGPGLVRRVQEERGAPMTARLEAKLRFWALADPVEDVLHGMENDLPDLSERRLADLRTLLSP
ncbi:MULTISPECIES: phosphotransferase [Actinomadura]|uniref:Phosphotransferase n=1 Tax=Actinomadura yumaensis TaxID=111807 RepID=A0ABW2CSU3_9ACTN|nr:phosphotransferase [Actinomadura sp. J1-007]MWK35282.1 phosphotransferase [Actinomadura sp. J1-007]